jgi:hypothetical protein
MTFAIYSFVGAVDRPSGKSVTVIGFVAIDNAEIWLYCHWQRRALGLLSLISQSFGFAVIDIAEFSLGRHWQWIVFALPSLATLNFVSPLPSTTYFGFVTICRWRQWAFDLVAYSAAFGFPTIIWHQLQFLTLRFLLTTLLFDSHCHWHRWIRLFVVVYSAYNC